MKDHQLGYTLPLQPLGAKIERHQATPEDRRAIDLCKFEQKRHEVEPVLRSVLAKWGTCQKVMLTDGETFVHADTGEQSFLTGWRIISEQA